MIPHPQDRCTRRWFRFRNWDDGALRLAVLGLILTLCLGVILYLLTDVREKLTELGSSRQDNVQWTLTQLEVEYLKFENAVGEARLAIALAATVPPGEASQATTGALDELRLRYDILYSRLVTLSGGSIYLEDVNDPSVTRDFDQLKQDIFSLVPVIDGPNDALALALEQIAPLLKRQHSLVRHVLSQSNHAQVARSDIAREGIFEVLRGLALATLALVAVLTAMVALFRRVALIARRRLEEGRAASARLETIFSTSRDAIVVLDSQGHLRSANNAARQMFDLTEAENRRSIPAAQFLQRDGPDGPVSVTGADLFAACAGAARTGYRLTGQRLSGGRFPVELSMNPTDNDGLVLVCVIRDISHQVATEAELMGARDKALAGERAKARFLAVISHEMRTPLNGILGTLDLITEETDPAETKSFLKVVRSSAQTLLQLVNDVLDITQIEGGDVAIRPAPFDLDALIDDIMTSERPRALRAGNRLLREGENPAGWVQGDATRLRQVLLNLVSNAVKFTEAGEIRVALHREDEAMIVMVTDTGIGMTAEEQERIFDDFVRLDGAVHRQIQGTGLGLGIARQLTQAMGGTIAVESRPGRGSCFALRLPLPACAPVQRSAAAPVGTAEARPMDILLVEDNPTNRFVAGRMLARDGHRVQMAVDGQKGVEAAAARAYEVILMDVSMPVMDGFEATRAIRAGNGPSAGARIIALTAHAGEDMAEALRAAGLDDVIAKPIRGDVLRRLLSEPARNGAPPTDACSSGLGRAHPRQPEADPSLPDPSLPDPSLPGPPVSGST